MDGMDRTDKRRGDIVTGWQPAVRFVVLHSCRMNPVPMYRKLKPAVRKQLTENVREEQPSRCWTMEIRNAIELAFVANDEPGSEIIWRYNGKDNQ